MRGLVLAALLLAAVPAAAQDFQFGNLGGGAGAGTGEPFVTVGNDADLTAERAIAAGSGIAGADGGANSTYTLDLDPSELAADTTPEFDDILPGEASGGTLESYTPEALFGYSTTVSPQRRFSFRTELINDCPGSAVGNEELIRSVTGTGAATGETTITSASHPAVMSLETGTTTTGRAFCGTRMSAQSVAFGDGIWTFTAIVRIPTLSDGTESYAVAIGFIDSTGIDSTDGAAFVYENNGGVATCGDSANWQRYTAAGGTRTCNATSTAVTTGWVRLTVIVNAAATSAEWFIDGTSVGTETTNLPSGVAQAVGFGAIILKSAGTTNRLIDLDVMAVDGDLATAR